MGVPGQQVEVLSSEGIHISKDNVRLLTVGLG